ncbi:MAG: glycosyltransferase family 4 protein [Phycisphaerae bacterium]|nr:glycosyltransferase family 4 protein [Phycisphaerae bacterium]
MGSENSGTSARLTLCLIADDEVIDRFPAAIRYLQIGLLDESVDAILVLPDCSRAESLVAGPSAAVTYCRRRWPLDRFTSPRVTREIREHLAAKGSAAGSAIVVHSLSITAAPLAQDIASGLGSEFVSNVASSAFRHQPRIIQSLDRASALVVPAAGLRDVIQLTPLVSKRVELIRPSVAIDPAIAAFQTADHVPSIVFAGALTLDCGADVLIRAAARVIQEGDRVLVIISGKGPAELALRHLVISLKMVEHVTFTGRLDHLHAALDAADIFCVPRAIGTFREEPIHAMAAGLAIIAAQGVYCDGLVHQENAILIPNADETELAAAIRRLCHRRDEARRLAANAREAAARLYSVSRMVSEFVRLYRQLTVRHQTIQIGASPSSH